MHQPLNDDQSDIILLTEISELFEHPEVRLNQLSVTDVLTQKADRFLQGWCISESCCGIRSCSGIGCLPPVVAEDATEMVSMTPERNVSGKPEVSQFTAIAPPILR